MPDQLAANLTVGTLPVPTKHNPADAPSRDAPVRRRPAAPYPAWLTDLDSGDYSTWDGRYGAARSALTACLLPVGTGAARSRAVGPPDELLGQAAGPPYDFAFQRNGLRRGDENSLIGDGPAGRREHSAPARTGDIRGPRGSTEHRAQRTAAFRKFEQWLESLGLPPDPVERLDGVTVGKLLVEYAQVQYARGAARNSVKLALLGVQDRYAHWRVALRSAWQTFSNFERETPGESHLPVPKVAYRTVHRSAFVVLGFPLAQPGSGDAFARASGWKCWRRLLPVGCACPAPVSCCVCGAAISAFLPTSAILTVQGGLRLPILKAAGAEMPPAQSTSRSATLSACVSSRLTRRTSRTTLCCSPRSRSALAIEIVGMRFSAAP